jgi:hypothetical protein
MRIASIKNVIKFALNLFLNTENYSVCSNILYETQNSTHQYPIIAL